MNKKEPIVSKLLKRINHFVETYSIVLNICIVIFLMAIALIFAFPGEIEGSNKRRLIQIEHIQGYGDIVYDTQTKVEYWIYFKPYAGSMIMLVDENGKPLLYKGE